MKRRVLAITALAVALTACGIPCAAQTASALLLDRSQIHFNDRDIGTSTPQTLTLTNKSSTPISPTLTFSGDNTADFSYAVSTCLNNLQPQSTCDVVIVFRPLPPAQKPAGDKAASSSPAPASNQQPAANGQPPAAKSSNDNSPGGIPWPLDRAATLEVSDGKNQPQKVLLSGRAFQNVAISPSSLTLNVPVAGATSAAQLITLTNFTQSKLTNVAATSSDGLEADSSGCVDIASQKNCTIYVRYSASSGQVPGAGSLALTATLTTPADPAGPSVPLTRIVVLRGGCPHWYSFCREHSGTWLLISVGFCYFLGLVLVRWHMIAKPARGQVLAEIDAVRARVTAEAGHLPQSDDTKRRLAEINGLLDVAAYPFKHKRFRDVRWFTRSTNAAVAKPQTRDDGLSAKEKAAQEKAAEEGLLSKSEYPAASNRFFNAVFWTRGQELAGWSLAHEAEVEFIALLPPELVRAQLETAEQELRQINTPVTVALADRASQALTSGEAVIVEQARHLLQMVLALIEPVDVPQAARDALLADLRGRASAALQAFSNAVPKNPATATDVNLCKSGLQATLVAADACLNLTAGTTNLLTINTFSPASLGQLTRLSEFLKELATATHGARTSQQTLLSIPDQNAALKTCTSALALLTAVGGKAATLAADMKVAPPQAGQSNAWQALLKLCQSQVSVTEAMTHATTPSAGLKLVQQVLENFINENDAVLKISHCGPDEMGESIRDEVVQLAKMVPWNTDLVNDIKAAVTREIAAPVQRWRAILVEAREQINASFDNNYFEVCAWHNRLIWLVGCALLFIIALGLAFPANSILLLVGAVGGLLSRLQRTAKGGPVSPEAATDSTWGSLFLSPLTGAFSAWGGILLIIVGLKFNLFGSALSLDWQNPNEPVALAIALLFGFSERFFDNIAKKLEGTIEKTPASVSKPATPVTAAKPAISSITPSSAPFGKPAPLTVTGANFSSDAKVTITDETGAAKPQPQVKFNSATSIAVTYTPTGTKPYTATLTVTNPDNQTATATLNITAPPP